MSSSAVLGSGALLRSHIASLIVNERVNDSSTANELVAQLMC